MTLAKAIGLPGAAVLAVLALGPDISAQEEGEKKELIERIDKLERRVKELEKEKTEAERDTQGQTGFGGDTASPGASPGLMGRLGQTTRFSKTFNPAIGIAVDIIADAHTGHDSGPHRDSLWLRAAELNLAAQIDPYGYGYVVVEGNDDHDEGVNVIEAAAVMNRLPWNLSLKAGRLLADHGKLGQRHDHELPFVEKPGVYYDYIGGSAQVTGAEIHHWFGLTDEVPVRWSAGVYNRLEGHGHRIGERRHHHADEEPFGHRHLDNLAYNLRVTGYKDLTDRSSIQAGTSLLWAPGIRDFHENAATGIVRRIETRRTISAVDVTYKWRDPSSQREFLFGVETFQSYGKYFHEEHVRIEGSDSFGGYAWAEYSWDPHWAAGTMAGAYEMARFEDVGRKEFNAWLTWKISHFNWLRLQYRFNDLERDLHAEVRDSDSHEVMAQWILVFGSHAHGLDW